MEIWRRTQTIINIVDIYLPLDGVLWVVYFEYFVQQNHKASSVHGDKQTALWLRHDKTKLLTMTRQKMAAALSSSCAVKICVQHATMFLDCHKI